MNTQKFATTFMLAMLVLSFVAPMVLAEDEEVIVISTNEDEVDLPNAGIGPGSALYGLENSWDKLRLAMTFRAENRINKALEIAEERLAEAEEAAEDDPEAAEQARQRYGYFVAKAEAALEKIEAKQTGGAEDALEKTVRAQERIQLHREKVEAVHNRILERQRTRMTEEQIAKLEEVFGKMQTRAENAEAVVLQKRENIATRYKVLTGKTDAEVEEALEGYRAEVQERVKAKVQEKARSENDSEDEDNGDEETEESGQGTQAQSGQGAQ